MTRGEHTAFIIKMMDEITKPIFLAAITTLVSFLAFCVTKILPIREFGFFSAFGVLTSFFIAVTLTPAILILAGPRPLKARKRRAAHAPESRLADIFVRATSHKRLVLSTAALLFIVSIFGSTKLIIDNVFVEYFKDSTAIVRSDKFIREKFGGSKVLSVVVEAPDSETLLHPSTLSALDSLSSRLAEMPLTGKVMGFTDLVKRINQVFNADESPDGLSPSAAPQTADADSDFGFGFDDGLATDSFDFDDSLATGSFGFGFADGDAAAAASDRPADNASAAAKASAAARYGLSDELISALDAAASGDPALRDFVFQLKRLVNYEGASYYEIPSDPARYGKTESAELGRLVANYLTLLSGSISNYANDSLEPTAIRTLVQLRTTGQLDTNIVVNEANAFVAANFPKNVNVTVGGVALVELSLTTAVVRSVFISMIIAFIAIFAIVSISNRSAIAGLIGVLPLALLTASNFALMGFLGIKLNIGTAMISSLTMGIGIDYTIHFIESYKRAWHDTAGREGFLFTAYKTSGLAIITDAVSTGAGFAVLLFSQFTMLTAFGLLVAASLLLSAAVGLIVIPTLLLGLKPKFITRA
jgi:predicted RND superfamily exporter protein